MRALIVLLCLLALSPVVAAEEAESGNVLIDVVLPLSLAFIMFSLGLGLTLADFQRVVDEPKVFAVGLLNQMVVLPIVGFALAHAVAFALPARPLVQRVFQECQQLVLFMPVGAAVRLLDAFGEDIGCPEDGGVFLHGALHGQPDLTGFGAAVSKAEPVQAINGVIGAIGGERLQRRTGGEQFGGLVCGGESLLQIGDTAKDRTDAFEAHTDAVRE